MKHNVLSTGIQGHTIWIFWSFLKAFWQLHIHRIDSYLPHEYRRITSCIGWLLLMDILILFLEQRNQQSSWQWVAFGLFYIYRFRIANTYAQILILNFIHLNNVLRHKRIAGTPDTRGAFSYCHLSSSENCFIQDILYAKCRSFLAVLISYMFSQL